MRDADAIVFNVYLDAFHSRRTRTHTRPFIRVAKFKGVAEQVVEDFFI